VTTVGGSPQVKDDGLHNANHQSLRGEQLASGPYVPFRASNAASRSARIDQGWIYHHHRVYTECMAKHLVDIDETALAAAQAELGTASMKDTVNEALRRATDRRSARVQKALDRLGQRRLPPREEAWR